MMERSIIFSAPMVRALLAGTKTQTRRLLKLPKKTHSGGPIYERPDMGGWEATTHGGGGCFTVGRGGERIPAPEIVAIWHKTTGTCMAAPYQIGDRLWVRESWRTASDAYNDLKPIEMSGEEKVLFEADGDWSQNKTTGRRRAAMHMPRWASRLTLLVTDVRVERLQAISERDCWAEGVENCGEPDGGRSRAGHGRELFRSLWESINGPGAWEANPWVVAVTFTVERKT